MLPYTTRASHGTPDDREEAPRVTLCASCKTNEGGEDANTCDFCLTQIHMRTRCASCFGRGITNQDWECEKCADERARGWMD